jgi:hypothetical protein
MFDGLNEYHIIVLCFDSFESMSVRASNILVVQKIKHLERRVWFMDHKHIPTLIRFIGL